MYTPCEVGFWDDIFTQTFCDQVSDPRGGEAIMRLREFILLEGNLEGRIPKKYQLQHIRSVMQLRCPLPKLAKALKENHFLRRRRQTWYYPNWIDTPMGAYAKERLRWKEAKAALREKAHEAALERARNGGTSTGSPGDIHGTSQGDSPESKKGRPKDAAEAPSGGGDGGALTRWNWFRELHPRPDNPALCKRLLGALTPEEWNQLQFALPKHALMYRGRSTRRIALASKYLQSGIYWELKQDTTPKREPGKAAKKEKEHKKTKEQEAAEKQAQALTFLLEQLADPHVSEKQKQKARDHWESFYGDRPWEHGTREKAA